ncbi:MAG: aminoacyl-tRNA hydrolase [Lentisphaerae bacterium]|nr:MAG: aminoacyl-tRNA hydrolase [Lentisphaerota bacterium]
MSEIRAIIGLGNPGPEYEQTRHNIGFMILDELYRRKARSISEKAGEHRHNSFIWRWRVRNRDVWLQKPLTYMNLSGTAVSGLCKRNGLTPEELLVIVDDVALPLGRLRLRAGGSDGGHNGLKDIAEKLGTINFPRLRVGVGRPGEQEILRDYVLSPFREEERDLVQRVIDYAVESIVTACYRGLPFAMNQVNGLKLDCLQEQNEERSTEGNGH